MRHSIYRFQHVLSVTLIAVAGLTGTMALPTQAAAPPVLRQAPGYYRMMVGDFEVTALLDGTHDFPVDEVMTNARPGQVARLLRSSVLKPPVEGSINAFLVNTGRRLILIDSGAGVLYGADGGHLLANLRAAGYAPEQVDEVYLTHLHRDHVGGVNSNGAMAFPNATVRVSGVDAAYWLNRANQASAPAYLSSMFDGAIDSLAPYVAAGRLVPFQSAGELSPGIRAIPSAGHTPGHSWYAIESRGEKLVVWGDMVHVAAVQFPAPAIRVKYDSDADAAERERRLIFADASKRGYWVAAAHISFPGIGHVRLVGRVYEWLPASYTTRFPAPSSAAAAKPDGRQ
ncbi:MAG: MBL fold metallo-hydrolase [Caldimonas sp.]